MKPSGHHRHGGMGRLLRRRLGMVLWRLWAFWDRCLACLAFDRPPQQLPARCNGSCAPYTRAERAHARLTTCSQFWLILKLATGGLVAKIIGPDRSDVKLRGCLRALVVPAPARYAPGRRATHTGFTASNPPPQKIVRRNGKRKNRTIEQMIGLRLWRETLQSIDRFTETAAANAPSPCFRPPKSVRRL